MQFTQRLCSYSWVGKLHLHSVGVWQYLRTVRLPVMPRCVPAAAVDPPDLDSAPPDSVSAPAAGSFPAPAPQQQTANHLESPGKRRGENKYWGYHVTQTKATEGYIVDCHCSTFITGATKSCNTITLLLWVFTVFIVVASSLSFFQVLSNYQ